MQLGCSFACSWKSPEISVYLRDGPFDFSWGGGANPKKNIEHVSNGRKKNRTSLTKKYRAQKNSNLAILYIERKIHFPWVFFLLIVSVPPWLTIPEVYMQNTNLVPRAFPFLSLGLIGAAFSMTKRENPWERGWQNTNRYKPVLTTLTSIIQLSTNYFNGIPKNPNLNTESPTLL
jgi:hypothetical protein